MSDADSVDSIEIERMMGRKTKRKNNKKSKTTEKNKKDINSLFETYGNENRIDDKRTSAAAAVRNHILYINAIPLTDARKMNDVRVKRANEERQIRIDSNTPTEEDMLMVEANNQKRQ
jgi:hypothetical protein